MPPAVAPGSGHQSQVHKDSLLVPGLQLVAKAFCKHVCPDHDVSDFVEEVCNLGDSWLATKSIGSTRIAFPNTLLFPR